MDTISKSIVVELDALCSVCGYFTTQTDTNNRYGCNHPENEEYEMLWKDTNGFTHRGYENDPTKPKTKQGKCYSFSCPLAVECDLQDLKEHDKYYYDLWKNENYEPFEAGAQLMLVSDKNLIDKLK